MNKLTFTTILKERTRNESENILTVFLHSHLTSANQMRGLELCSISVERDI